MKLSWTFYPKGETASITLTVVYVPDLDAENLPSGGFLHAETNTAYVDWTTYKRFDSIDVANRKDAFQRLTSIVASTRLMIAGKEISLQKHVR